jgi:hypothetical protein
MFLLLFVMAAAPPVPVVPLRHAHAHNDYAHRRPLLDALDRGFCSVEADVFLVRGGLLVGHTWFDLLPGRTLEKLYLEPLRRRARACKGQIYPGGSPFYLLIEIKTDAKKTYPVLDRLLSRYADVLSVVKDGKLERKAVTVVVTGNCPRDVIHAQKIRRAAIDGGAGDLDSTAPAHLIPWISARWSSQFRWRGQGEMPATERAKLRDMVKKADKHGRLVRFWATPEKPALWRELRAAGVHLINTDRLDELRAFLLAQKGKK